MTVGEIKEINDEYIVSDLIRAGYIEKIKEKKEIKTVKKTEKK